MHYKYDQYKIKSELKLGTESGEGRLIGIRMEYHQNFIHAILQSITLAITYTLGTKILCP